MVLINGTFIVKGQIEVPSMDYKIKHAKNYEVVEANCLMCHSFGYMLNQGAQPKKFWVDKVHKMVKAFHAPITKNDQKTIAEFMFKNYGNKKLR